MFRRVDANVEAKQVEIPPSGKTRNVPDLESLGGGGGRGRGIKTQKADGFKSKRRKQSPYLFSQLEEHDDG